MLKTKLTRTLFACLLAAVLMLSLFTVSAFAEESADGNTATEDVSADTGANDTAGEDDAAPTDTTGAEDGEETPADTTGAEDGEETPADTTGAEDGEHSEDDGHDHGTESTETEEKKGLSLGNIISYAVLGVAIIAVVIYCLTHKEKVKAWASALKSEFKKITWSSWSQVRKNTIIVLVVIIVVGLVIALLDYLFHTAFVELGKF